MLGQMCTEGVKGKPCTTRQSFKLAFTVADEMNFFVCKSNLLEFMAFVSCVMKVVQKILYKKRRISIGRYLQ